jgi:hypothetical protein
MLLLTREVLQPQCSQWAEQVAGLVWGWVQEMAAAEVPQLQQPPEPALVQLHRPVALLREMRYLPQPVLAATQPGTAAGPPPLQVQQHPQAAVVMLPLLQPLPPV